MVDVGGGSGALLVELLRRRLELRGVVFDLPEVANEAERRVADFGLEQRCEVVGGSFFDGVPQGDTFVLGGILHDWPDDRAREILDRIHAASRPGGRLLVLESVVDAQTGIGEVEWLDLLMLVISRGRERTAAEWRSLLQGAGFEIEQLEDGLIVARPD